MPRQIIWCIVHLLIRCVPISLLIAIVSLIKLKLNIFIIILFFNRKNWILDNFIFLIVFTSENSIFPIVFTSELCIKIGYDHFHLPLSPITVCLIALVNYQVKLQHVNWVNCFLGLHRPSLYTHHWMWDWFQIP